MKVKNVKMHGGRRPVLLCPCGKQIDPQAAGPVKPIAGFGKNRILYHASDCGMYLGAKG